MTERCFSGLVSYNGSLCCWLQTCLFHGHTWNDMIVSKWWTKIISGLNYPFKLHFLENIQTTLIRSIRKPVWTTVIIYSGPEAGLLSAWASTELWIMFYHVNYSFWTNSDRIKMHKTRVLSISCSGIKQHFTCSPWECFHFLCCLKAKLRMWRDPKPHIHNQEWLTLKICN